MFELGLATSELDQSLHIEWNLQNEMRMLADARDSRAN